jgi:very-short-patch-repair endonuclease
VNDYYLEETYEHPDLTGEWYDYVERARGTGIRILETRGDMETALLFSFSDLRYDRYGQVYDGEAPYRAVILTQPEEIDKFTEERCQSILEVLQVVHRGDDDISITAIVAAPRMVDGNWLTEFRMRNSIVAQSSELPAVPEPRARSGEENIVMNAFRKARAERPAHDTLVLGMNVRLQLANNKIVEIDIVVVGGGGMVAIEIDGDSHRRANRYAADASRDDALRDAGIHVERVVAEDMNRPEEVQALVRKVLDRLASR